MDELLKKLFGFNYAGVPVLFSGGGGSGDSDNGDPDAGDDGTDTKDDDMKDDDVKDDDVKDKKDNVKQTKQKDDVDKDKPKMFDEDYVRALRGEAAKYRKERKEEAEKVSKLDAQLKAIQKALGLEEDEPDAGKLEEELSALKAKLKEEHLHNRFMQAAIKAGADPELTYAYLKYRKDLDNLDVEDAAFTKDLNDLIKLTLRNNPKLKVESPKKSGDDQSKDKGSKGGFSMNDLIRKAAGRT